MKKLLVGMSLLFCSALYANQSLQFVNKTIKLDTRAPKVRAVVNYPQILNPTGAGEVKFNVLARKWAFSELQDFKKSVADNSKYPIPKEVQAEGSTLTLSYDLTTLEPHKFVSLRFSDDTFIAGAAHGSHKYSAINYDLTKNKTVTFSDLFKDDQAALANLSKIATVKVTAKLKEGQNGQNVDIFTEGLSPTAKNYQVWNLTPEGIRITFNEYQVAAYVYGPQIITVSYQEVADQLNPEAPITTCLKANNCQFNSFASSSNQIQH